MQTKESISQAFLNKGGIYLKKELNSAKEPVIMEKSKYFDWRLRLTCTSSELRDKIFNHLTRKQREFFKAI